jgi:hypothetical protein
MPDTIDDNEETVAEELRRVLAENAALRAQLTAGPDKVLRCAFCGQPYLDGTPDHKSEALAEHIRQCPEHPVGKENRALREEEQRIHVSLICILSGTEAYKETTHKSVPEMMACMIMKENAALQGEVERLQRQHDLIEKLIVLPDTVPISYMELAGRVNAAECERDTLRTEIERLRSVLCCQGRRDSMSTQAGAPFDEDLSLKHRMEAGHA